jgi:hypothetical protein
LVLAARFVFRFEPAEAGPHERPNDRTTERPNDPNDPNDERTTELEHEPSSEN